jgi:hypothetical protein
MGKGRVCVLLARGAKKWEERGEEERRGGEERREE